MKITQRAKHNAKLAKTLLGQGRNHNAITCCCQAGGGNKVIDVVFSLYGKTRQGSQTCKQLGKALVFIELGGNKRLLTQIMAVELVFAR